MFIKVLAVLLGMNSSSIALAEACRGGEMFRNVHGGKKPSGVLSSQTPIHFLLKLKETQPKLAPLILKIVKTIYDRGIHVRFAIAGEPFNVTLESRSEILIDAALTTQGDAGLIQMLARVRHEMLHTSEVSFSYDPHMSKEEFLEQYVSALAHEEIAAYKEQMQNLLEAQELTGIDVVSSLPPALIPIFKAVRDFKDNPSALDMRLLIKIGQLCPESPGRSYKQIWQEIAEGEWPPS